MILLSAFTAAWAIIIGAYLWWRVRAWEGALVAVLSLIGLWATLTQMLGVPRPASHDILASFEDVPVIAYELKESEAIYLWIRREEPIAYRLPWDMPTAQSLHQAAQKAEEGKTELLGRRVAAGEWVFHPRPVEQLPPKE